MFKEKTAEKTLIEVKVDTETTLTFSCPTCRMSVRKSVCASVKVMCPKCRQTLVKDEAGKWKTSKHIVRDTSSMMDAYKEVSGEFTPIVVNVLEEPRTMNWFWFCPQCHHTNDVGAGKVPSMPFESFRNKRQELLGDPSLVCWHCLLRIVQNENGTWKVFQEREA